MMITAKHDDASLVRWRIATYAAVIVVLALGFGSLRNSTWTSSVQLHTVMEVAATLLALMVGVMALVRFHSKHNNTILFIGVGFLGTAFLDGYHAVVTSAAFKDFLPSTLPSLIPWSWVASRLFLSVLLWLSWVAWRREQRLGEAGRISERAVYALVALLTLASFAFFAFAPLPRAYYPELLFHRPEEFIPAAFFLLALVGYVHKGEWKHDPFEHWMVICLIISFLSQASFMSFSGQLFDTMFDAAHTLKKVTYVCVLTGLMISMYTSFRKAEDTTANFRAVIDNAVDAIIVIDEQGSIQAYNPGAERIFGWPPEQAIGRNVNILMPEPYSAEHDGYLGNYLRTGHAGVIGSSRELTGRRKDGREFPIELSVSEFELAGRGRNYTGVVRDITERKRTKDELRLSHEILKRQTKELERSNKELDDFAHLASHDLKEPLRGIHNYATFLNEDYADLLDEDGRHKLKTLTVLSKRMERLIDDLLTYSRVGKARETIKQTELNDVLAEIISSLEIFLEEKNVEIKLPHQLPTVTCNGTRVGEVFRNLITNAAKYNDKAEKWIGIGCDAAPSSDEKSDAVGANGTAGPIFYVRDNGIGIREKHQNAVFGIFKRLHGRNAYGGGTGMGLGIVKKIVETQGGQIWLESEFGEGTTFYFTIGEHTEP